MEKIKLLVIDDEIAIIETLSLIFSIEPDFEVSTLSDVTDWRASVERHRPEIILVDFRMPVMNGDEFLKTLKDSRCCPWVKAVALISATPLSADQIQSAGADAFIRKPFQIDQLVSDIRALAGRKAAA
jgi:CheY-like chemotaxis protein